MPFVPMKTITIGDDFEWGKEERTEAEVTVTVLILERQCCQAM